MKNQNFSLKIYSITLTLFLGFILISGFQSSNSNQKFDEITVERINIVEPDGKLKMVISNQERQHPGITNGKIIKRTYKRPPGIIFFNQIGDEMGGLVYGENGENGHFGSLTWDKFKGDQTVGFRHLEGSNGRYSSGISIWQQPKVTGDIINEKIDSIQSIEDATIRKAAFKKMRDDNLLSTTRLFIGKSRDDASLLIMNDEKGRERIVMKVDAEGKPKIEFLDENGVTIHSIPE